MQFYTAGLANALVSESGYEVWVVGSAARRRNAFDKRVRLLPTYSFSGTGLSLPALNLFNFYGLLKQIDDACPSLIHIIGPHLFSRFACGDDIHLSLPGMMQQCIKVPRARNLRMPINEQWRGSLTVLWYIAGRLREP
jgi:hypothetical protein